MKIVLAVVGGLAAIVILYFGVLFVAHGGNRDFLAIDACLDSGGKWNYPARTCEH
jgi:hypothetical protein